MTRKRFSCVISIMRLSNIILKLCHIFSHPNVHGILHWGFWDRRHWKGSDASLVDGANLKVYYLLINMEFYLCHETNDSQQSLINTMHLLGLLIQENAAGLMWKRLFHKDWRSSGTYSQRVTRGATTKIEKKVFYGSYKVKLRSVSGKLLATRSLQLTKDMGKASIYFSV